MIALSDVMTLDRMAHMVKETCDRVPGHVFSTRDLVACYYIYPEKEIYKALSHLGNVVDFPYVEKGEPVKRYGRDNYPNLWRCPSTGPCELPVLRKVVPVTLDARVLDVERDMNYKVAGLEQRIAELEAQLGERIKTVEMLLGI